MFKILFLMSAGMASLLYGQGLAYRSANPIPPQLEVCYERGLRYLANGQAKAGNWKESRYGREPGVVGLCIKAFLATGEDPNHGPYSTNIHRAVSFILKSQDEGNGYIGSSMYNHGFATLALAECYGMVDNPNIDKALKKAVDLILSAQERNPKKAWRYTPDSQDADTTVSGCQIVALIAARNAGLYVPQKAIDQGLAYMEKCKTKEGSYGYSMANGGRVNLTAIAVAAFSLAKKKDTEACQAGISYLNSQLTYRDQSYPYYFEYYMSQALFQASEKMWSEWNDLNIRYLTALQASNGSWPGERGVTFNTAAALLSLALNYCLLPIYEK